MTLVLVQRGTWQGAERDIYLEAETGSAFFTAAHDYKAETGRGMPEIVEPCGGLRTIAETTEMRWAFDYGPHGMYARTATAAQRAQSNALYLKYNMSRVSTGRPVINGTHTTGFYLDVATTAFQNWLLVNGHRYGLTRPLGDADPNHWRYTPGTATVALHVTSLDGSTAAPRPKGKTMNLFHDLSTSPFLFALAGGSPGTPANWLETSDSNFANQLSAQIGASSAGLSHDSFLAWRAAYLAPVTIANVGVVGSSPVDESGVIKAIQALEADLETHIDALPVQIDQFADGKKQS
jgi:hypothetical protein